jgi:hypothetical protein
MFYICRRQRKGESNFHAAATFVSLNYNNITWIQFLISEYKLQNIISGFRCNLRTYHWFQFSYPESDHIIIIIIIIAGNKN